MTRQVDIAHIYGSDYKGLACQLTCKVFPPYLIVGCKSFLQYSAAFHDTNIFNFIRSDCFSRIATALSVYIYPR